MDLFTTQYYHNRNPQVEKVLRDEGFEHDLVELPASVLPLIDVAKFQTRDVSGVDNFVDMGRVEGFVETIKNGDPMPACILFYVNNKYIALDGRHRIDAHKLAGSASFVGYVITKIDESKIWMNGLRLSNLLNEMNGERAGKDEKEKKERKNAIELCAKEMFALINAGALKEDVLREIPKKYKLTTGTHRRYATGLLDRYSAEIIVAGVTSGAIAKKLIDGIGPVEIQATQAIIRRCEPDDAVKVAETINAVKNYGIGAQKVNEILKANEHNPTTVILKTLREAAGLDDNNIKMQVADRTYQNRQSDFTKAMHVFSRQLTFRTPFHGEEKIEVMKRLNLVKKEIDNMLGILESV
jgi:hypothetical protein